MKRLQGRLATTIVNKNARIPWAVFVRGKALDARHVGVKPTTAVLPTAEIAPVSPGLEEKNFLLLISCQT